MSLPVLTAATWSEVSALLDEVLALPPEARDGFVEALDGERAVHRDTLRALLAQSAAVETGDFLATLPRLTRVAAAPAGALTELSAGDSIGPYRLLSELGTGGMGAVWLAERSDGQLKRKVALKLPRLVWAKGLAERMARERDILASLEHPHIARLYDAGVDQHGRPYLALEYVEGQPIDVYAKERGLTVRQKLDLLLQVCAAVAFAHSRLVVHRDLKPSNILVTADGQVRLLDFGIAKLIEADSAKETQLTQLAGRALTLDYASPEQIKGEPIGTASDVYSLGVVAYELLTGAKPYKLKRGSAAELEEAIAAADPVQASDVVADRATKKQLRGDLDAILNKALKKVQGDRYATVDAVAEDLRRHLSSQPVSAQADAVAYRVAKFLRRYRLQAATAAIATLALSVGTAVALWQAGQARAKAAQAEREGRRATAVQNFMKDLFQANAGTQSDPLQAQKTTARELLDLGAKRIRTDLATEPEAKSEVLRTLAQMYEDLALSEQAAELAGERVRLLRQMYGDRDGRVVDGLMFQAWQFEDPQRSLPLLLEAKQILDALGETATRRRGEVMTAIAKMHMFASAVDNMQEAADEAIRILRPYQVEKEDRMSSALLYAARARQQRGQVVEAEALMREAVAEQKKGGAPVHRAVVQTLVTLGEVQAMLMKYEAAETTFREAIDLARTKLGERDITTLSTQRRFGAVLHAGGRRAEGRPLLERALVEIRDLRGDDDPNYTSGARISLAAALLAEGDLGAALPLAEQGMAPSLKHYPGTQVLANEMRLVAVIALHQGRYAKAATLLGEAVAIERALQVQPWVRNRFRLAEARLALATNQVDQALARLDEIVPPSYVAALPLDVEGAERDILRARALLQLGRRDEALGVAQRAQTDVRASAVRERFAALEAEVALVIGMAALPLDAKAAVESMEGAVALFKASHTGSSPWLAEAKLALAEALEQSGAGAQAASLRRAAESALVKSGAGPHFRPFATSSLRRMPSA
ncbi:MAG: protein kinase [Burkholderiales bacterium]|nr:protein kinase [Burkholderiales bacterium]